MNVTEMATVLAKAAIFDFRSVEEPDVMAWHEACGDLDAADALTAVSRWYRDRSDRLMPSHLREAVLLVRTERRRAALVAKAEEGLLPPQLPPGRPFSELPAEMQATLKQLSRGLLQERFPSEGEVVNERFGRHVLPGPERIFERDVYGGHTQEIDEGGE